MKEDLIKKSVLRSVQKVAEVEANMAWTPWPPTCTGIIHQPKRPQKKNKK